MQPAVTPVPGRLTRTTAALIHLKHVVNEIIQKPESAFFRHPVDQEAAGVTDFYKYIRNPIDLNTINARLDNQYYYSGMRCKSDLLDVFTNVLITFSPDRIEFHQAFDLKMFVYERICKQGCRYPDEEDNGDLDNITIDGEIIGQDVEEDNEEDKSGQRLTGDQIVVTQEPDCGDTEIGPVTGSDSVADFYPVHSIESASGQQDMVTMIDVSELLIDGLMATISQDVVPE